MTSLPLLEDMGRISDRMVEAARASDWDQLVALEQNVARLRDRIADNDEHCLVASQGERVRKLALIRHILANDAEVRRHVEPRMEQIRIYLGKVSTAGSASGNTASHC